MIDDFRGCALGRGIPQVLNTSAIIATTATIILHFTNLTSHFPFFKTFATNLINGYNQFC
jgi:hypothetical protein